MRRLFLAGFLAVACSTGGSSDERAPVRNVRSAIVGGRPSGDEDNAAVYIETKVEDTQLRCSGRIIAPGLVLGARHCFLNRRAENVLCNPDGTPVDIADAVSFEIQPPEAVSVFIGSNRTSQKKIAVRAVLANVETTICRGDVAYLVLAEPGLATRTPIRRALPTLGDSIRVTGWGYVDDSQRTTLPNTRSSVDTKVIDYGPPALPPGVFSIPGNTLCLGDSGASALVGAAVIGTYSRIDDAAHCQNEFGRNYLTAVMSEPELLAKAYAEIGETPWFEGEQKPWLAKAGAACATNDDCASAVCEDAACRAGCGPTGLACAIGQTCVADASCMVDTVPDAGVAADAGPSVPPSAPPEDGGCSVVRGPRKDGDGDLVFVAIAIACALRRARAARRSCPPAASCSRRAQR